jgi:beta propeller repeat protein
MGPWHGILWSLVLSFKGHYMKARRSVRYTLVIWFLLAYAPILKAGPWQEFPVFDPAGDRTNPAVSGHIIVCESIDSSRRHLKIANVLDPNNILTARIRSSTKDLFCPDISGSTLVWHLKDDRWADYDVDGATISNLADLRGFDYYSISSFTNDEIRPVISGDIVSYQIYDPSEKIWYLHARYFGESQRKRTRVGDADLLNPAISDGILAWQDNRNGNWDIRALVDVMNSHSEQIEVYTGPNDQQTPAVSGSTVVWESNDLGCWGILGADVSNPDELLEIANHQTSDANAPAISYSKIVVWQDNRNGNWDIYGYNLAKGQEFQITDDLADQKEPDISYSPRLKSFVVVWQDNRSGNWEIYCAIIDGPEVSGGPIHFVDSKLRAVLGDPTAEEILGWRQLYAPSQCIYDLTGLEYALNLEELLLPYNQISDLSPLAGLVRLEEIALGGNQIRDISPLAGLIHVEELDLYWNQISDISPLTGLANLEFLVVTKNQVSDVSPLAELVNLRRLWLWKNHIHNISPLAGLSNLEILDLSDNRISDISSLADLTTLHYLALENNRIYDISSLAGLTRLQHLDLSNNHISDISPLVRLTNLSHLDLRDNPLNPEACSVHLSRIQENNPGITILYSVCDGASDPSSTPQRIIYVDDSAPGARTGTNWKNGYHHLQDALADASHSTEPIEIRVAQGMYKPDRGGDLTLGNREAAFQLINGVVVKGGYAGFDQADPNARDIQLHETILSGDLMGNDAELSSPKDLVGEPTRSDNSYSVVSASGTDISAVLEGFTIAFGSQRGGVYISRESAATISRCKMIWNMASGHGGGLYCGIQSTPVITHCDVSMNAAGDGGGLMANTGCSAKVIDCTFYSNYATRDGGAAYVEEDHCFPSFIRCTFTGNEALSEGGGIYVDEGTDPILVECIVSENSAGNGGGVFCDADSNPEMVDCLVNHNRAEHVGGGICCYQTSPTLADCAFEQNWAGRYGGGMHNETSNSTLVRCTFSGNTTDWCGGGLRNADGSSPLLESCVFTGNWSVREGGGVSNDEASPTLTNCLFAGNLVEGASWHDEDESKGMGGGIYSDSDSSASLLNCTFHGNSAEEGGAVHNSDSITTLTNCILWGNIPDEIDTDEGALEATYSNVKGGWTGEGNLDTDPLFVLPGNWVDANGMSILAPNDPNATWVDGDYHLMSAVGRWDEHSQNWIRDGVTSPCVDAGDTNSDWTAELWPHGGRINMGAYGCTPQASMSLSTTGNSADCNSDAVVDARDLLLLTRTWLTDDMLSPENVNHNGLVDFLDYAELAENWLAHIAP